MVLYKLVTVILSDYHPIFCQSVLLPEFIKKMVVQAYTPSYGQIIGQIEINIDFLPKLQNGYYLNPIATIQSNIASIGADPTQPYWVDWDLTTFVQSSAKNSPVLQSPLLSTYQGIVAFLSGGSVVDQHFINFQSQRFPFHGFWNLTPTSDYPSQPTAPISGQVNAITSSFATQSIPGDSVCIYRQYALPSSLDAFLNFRATLGTPDGTYVLTDFPSVFAEVL